MAHELLVENGQAAMFYVNEKPWHGLGRQLSKAPTSRKAIHAAGLDWDVTKAPLYVAGGTRLHEVKDRFALVRTDSLGTATCTTFGVVGRDYVPLQNVEAFDFFDPLVASGEATYETAGALRTGERIWILARLRGSIMVTEGDETRKYLLLSNSHDGKSSIQVKITPIRVVCNNTLTLALSQGGTIRVRHDHDMQEGLLRAQKLLGIVNSTYARIELLFKRMAELRADTAAVEDYFLRVFPDPFDRSDAAGAARASRLRQGALHLFRHGAGNTESSASNTVWAAYNGVTDLIDHRKGTARGSDHTAARLHSVWFGNGAAVKARALRLAEEWVGPIP